MPEWIFLAIKDLGIPTLFIGIATYLIKKYLEKRLNHSFDQKLKNHEQNLSLIAEAQKFDFQRKIQDFGLYTQKKHEVYLEMNRLAFKPLGGIGGLMGFRTELTYEEYNWDDLLRIMKRDKFPDGKIEDIYASYLKHSDEGIQKMKSFYRLIEFQEAENNYLRFQDFYRLNKIYLSEDIESNTKNILLNLNKTLSNRKVSFNFHTEQYDTPSSELISSSHKTQQKAKLLIDQQIRIMRKELSIGYYSSKEIIPTDGFQAE
ncbi:MAG: hypothetical protein ABJR05_12020 [Balneola sp.]